jgi:S-adenosylmethionine synthetase
MAGRTLFTSECVTPGHPDKVCDQVSDAVLDAVLAADPLGRVACETLVTTNLVVLAGEITTTARPDFEALARETIRGIGYGDPALGFDADRARVEVYLHEQSPDIARGVDADPAAAKEIGAGDQGMMFGYACDETEVLLPASAWWARRLVNRLVECRTSGAIPWLRPDGKTQVTVESRGGRPVRVHTVVVSTQHAESVGLEEIRRTVREEVIRPVFPRGFVDGDTILYINPTGRFVIGGPHGDSGLTGRKIIVDTYGGVGRHGGGAFSGKDPTKVDRSAALAARWVAKNVVAAGLASRCEVQLAYAIGVSRPVSIHLEDFGTARAPVDRIERAIRETFDLSPRGMIEALDLRRPIYRGLARDGHFGPTGGGRTWEETDRVDALRSLALPKARPAAGGKGRSGAKGRGAPGAARRGRTAASAGRRRAPKRKAGTRARRRAAR